MSTFTIKPAGVSDIGHVRETNEDHHLTSGDLLVVADGMGGFSRGDRASQLAVETVRGAFASEPTATGLVRAVRDANTAIRQQVDDDDSTMGTTIAAVARVDDRLIVVNVGDSRVYLFRRGSLTQLSTDHSHVADLVRAGEISEQEAAEHPERHVLTSALGIVDSVAPGVNHVRPRAGDRLLLCSDGLFNEVPADAIGAVLASVDRADEAADRLVAEAKRNGGSDNITVVVADIAV